MFMNKKNKVTKAILKLNIYIINIKNYIIKKKKNNMKNCVSHYMFKFKLFLR